MLLNSGVAFVQPALMFISAADVFYHRWGNNSSFPGLAMLLDIVLHVPAQPVTDEHLCAKMSTLQKVTMSSQGVPFPYYYNC